MLRNYLITVFRTINKHKAYSSINILGLSLGLACSFFIILWVQDELNYDRFHEEGDQIFQVMQHQTFGGRMGTGTSIPKPLDDVLGSEYPEITHTVLTDWGSTMVIANGDLAFRAEGRYFGSDVFSVFTFPLLIGDASTALINPESVVVTESLALRLFGPDWRTRDDVLGTILRIDNRLDASLTGVCKDIPANSSLQFEFILPMEEYIRRNDWVEHWGNNGLRLFARLEKGADAAQVSEKIKDLINDRIDMWKSHVFLKPFSETYLWSDYEDGVLVGGRIDYVRIFLIVALFVLSIAGINFMNLSTARSAQRAREIGVRKSLGATRSFLTRQFLGESILTAMLAFFVAMALVYLLLPSFNALTNKSISLSFVDSSVWLQFAGLSLIAGLLAGMYPALYLSSINVIEVFRSNRGRVARGAGLRKGLVVFQFIMSIVLIVGTITVYRQLSYIRAKDLGVDRENLLYMDFEGGIRDQFDTFKQEVLQESSVVNLASSSNNPLRISNNTIDPDWDGKDPDDNTLYSIISCTHDLIETMKIELKEGRLFSEDFRADSASFIINEKAAESMSMDEPVGQRLALWGVEGQIIGVVKDFHMTTFYRPIEPVIFRLSPEDTGILFVRIAGGETREAIAALELIYKTFNPEYPFSYRFLDDRYEEMYRSEVVIGTLANIFAILAIVIACLGLFGLASFMAEQRTKEIGIRKVLGASVSSVVVLLSREFIVLVLYAFAVAAPVAYVLMNDWLNEFTFRTEMGFGILVAAGAISVLIAWLTVSYQSIRVATSNPVVSLRSE